MYIVFVYLTWESVIIPFMVRNVVFRTALTYQQDLVTGPQASADSHPVKHEASPLQKE